MNAIARRLMRLVYTRWSECMHMALEQKPIVADADAGGKCRMAFVNATTLDENTLFLRALRLHLSENSPPRDRRLCITPPLVSQLNTDT